MKILKYFCAFYKQMEMTILQECESLPDEKRKHFVKMSDRGKITLQRSLLSEI